MTKEELEKEARAKYKTGNYPQLHPDHFAFIHGYLAGAEPREKQIQTLSERVLQLQKDKGILTDKVKELDTNVTYYAERAKNAELQGRDVVLKNKEYEKENAELKKENTALRQDWEVMKSTITDCEDLCDKYSKLEKENAELKEELEYAKSHCLFHGDCPVQKYRTKKT